MYIWVPYKLLPAGHADMGTCMSKLDLYGQVHVGLSILVQDGPHITALFTKTYMCLLINFQNTFTLAT